MDILQEVPHRHFIFSIPKILILGAATVDRLKNEMFYDRSWAGVEIEEFMKILNSYLIWHNEKRIKLSLDGMSPLEYRLSLGLAA